MLFFSCILYKLSKLNRLAYFITANIDSLVQPRCICYPEGFYYFFTKFLRPFVSGTDGVNCSATKFPTIFKHQVTQELLCCAFIAHTSELHHKTVGCNKIDSGINYRAVLRLGWEYLVLFIGPFIAVLLFSLKAKPAGFVHLWTHSPIGWKSETGHVILERNKKLGYS